MKYVSQILFLAVVLLGIGFSGGFSLTLRAQSNAQAPKNKPAFKKENWKLGVALYTFSTASFPEQLAYADSASLK